MSCPWISDNQGLPPLIAQVPEIRSRQQKDTADPAMARIAVDTPITVSLALLPPDHAAVILSDEPSYHRAEHGIEQRVRIVISACQFVLVIAHDYQVRRIKLTILAALVLEGLSDRSVRS